MTNYCAMEKRNKTWTVGTIGPCQQITPLGDVRDFPTFDEANTVAKEIANGKYQWLADPGNFINMR